MNINLEKGINGITLKSGYKEKCVTIIKEITKEIVDNSGPDTKPTAEHIGLFLENVCNRISK